ncbi:MAG TPA: hypothetical protein VFF98_16780 [Novosphingobium sp.]|nr:hypothetical protein [Novosphingobium sp.]HZV10324.1 hypothetical protein [Novosphingobium sp.]
MRKLSMLLAASLAVAGTAAALHAEDKAPVPAGFFRLQSVARLPGGAPDWDYLAYDSQRQRLFIDRRDDGLWVFDTRLGKVLRRMPHTEGAGATLLVPALRRGFVTNEDGSTTVFDMASLAVIKRLKFASDADAASYDPVSGRVAFVSADSQQVTLVDPRGLKVVGTLKVPTGKADGSAADGAGHILLNARDRAMVLQIDAASARVLAQWPVTGCSQPTGMAIDTASHRAFIGCRGAQPVLAVMNTQTGQVVQTLDIGRGNDGVVYDPVHHRILTTNGVDANIVAIHQDDADHYRIEQAVTTRPFARTMAYDPQRQAIFTVTAEGVVDPAQPVNTGPARFYPNAYFPGSMVVLTYAPTRK